MTNLHKFYVSRIAQIKTTIARCLMSAFQAMRWGGDIAVSIYLAGQAPEAMLAGSLK
jgi:hypothetical protein